MGVLRTSEWLQRFFYKVSFGNQLTTCLFHQGTTLLLINWPLHQNAAAPITTMRLHLSPALREVVIASATLTGKLLDASGANIVFSNRSVYHYIVKWPFTTYVYSLNVFVSQILWALSIRASVTRVITLATLQLWCNAHTQPWIAR